MFFVSMISRFIYSQSSYPLGAAKRILKYICGTMDLRIKYHKAENWVGNSDSDWAGHVMIGRELVDIC